MFSPLLQSLKPLINNPDRLQAAAEHSHLHYSLQKNKFGQPLVLPNVTPYLKSLLAPRTLSHIPEAGHAPLLHFAVSSEIAQQLIEGVELRRNIHYETKGLHIPRSCDALLYQFTYGEHSLHWLFDVQDRGINHAFCGWLKQGHIPTVVTSPEWDAIIQLPCRPDLDWEWFMDQAAAGGGDTYTLRQLKAFQYLQTVAEPEIGCDTGKLVIGHSLEQVLLMSRDVLTGNEMPETA